MTHVHGPPTLGTENTSRNRWHVFCKVHPLVPQGNKRNFKLPSLSLFCVSIFSIKMQEILARLHGHVCTAWRACNSTVAYLTLNSRVFSRPCCYGRAFCRWNCFSALTMISAVSGGVAMSERHRNAWRKGRYCRNGNQFNTLDLGTKSLYWLLTLSLNHLTNKHFLSSFCGQARR